MSRQYKPFSEVYSGIPLIIYPVKDEHPLEGVFQKSKSSIMEYIYSVYGEHEDILGIGSYHIVFVRRRDNKKMIDVRRCSYNPHSQSGPLMDCFTFADGVRVYDSGIASGDSIMVLGREEELRRSCKTINEYVDRNTHMPSFPDGFGPEETFF